MATVNCFGVITQEIPPSAWIDYLAWFGTETVTTVEEAYAACASWTGYPFWAPADAASFQELYGGGGGFPTLTSEGGALIAGAVALVWVTAWAFKKLAQMINQN